MATTRTPYSPKTSMSEDEFYDQLEALDLDWKLIGDGILRCSNGNCPIIAVLCAMFPAAAPEWQHKNGLWPHAAIKIGLPFALADGIVYGADSNKRGRARNRLMEVCRPTPL